ncbi:MAG: cation:proton antiporter [Andreesenia angusta]|nr:cation:proton antiporter [Andreesenia angusta]
MENSTTLLDNSFYALIIMLFTGVISGEISKKINVPDVVLYLLAGILVGPSVFNILSIPDTSIVNQVILVFGASFILYCGGREVSLDTFREIKVTVLSLATLGVLISTALVGSTAHFLFNLDWKVALLTGAVIASTDPASLIPVLEHLPIAKRLKQTVICESAFNDAMGAVLVFSIIGVMTSGDLSFSSSIRSLVEMIGLGILTGIIIGFLISLSISSRKFGIFSDYAPIMSVIASILTYVVADNVGGSGYMACFIAGMVCGNKEKFGLIVPEHEYISQVYFREVLNILFKMAIFILLGTHVNFSYLAKYWHIALVITILLILVFRPISVFISTSLDFKAKWSIKEKLFISWVRETGVIPAAMCSIIVSQKLPGYDIISSIVFMAILITLILQGTTTGLLARKLGIDSQKNNC